MIVYIVLILGAVIALLASLTGSRLFLRIGGGMMFAVWILFLVWLPGILGQAHQPSMGLVHWIGSLGWGWIMAGLGSSLALISGFLRVKLR